jgi:mono/diheme cytochrome c family protein
VRCVTDDTADTSIYADVQLKPDTLYRLSAWIKGKGIRGKLSLNDHINRYETEKVTKAGDWTEVEVVYNSGKATKASINILHVAKGEGYFDDVKFTELTVEAKPESANLTGDPGRGENLFWKHPVAACMNCHMLGGKGSTVGPPLDGIAGRKDEAYILQSLLEPNKVLAQGYEALGVSPMPPMGLLLTPQELADIKAFLMTLKK